MKQSDKLWANWFSTFSPAVVNKPLASDELLALSQGEFIDEMYQLFISYSEYMNSMSDAARDLKSLRVFKLGSPKPSIMLLKDKEKLIISGDGIHRIRGRMVRFKGMEEQSEDLFILNGKINDFGMALWESARDHQRVYPEFIVKNILRQFAH